MESKNQIAIFGGGCFWCTEAVFGELRGVISVMPGYSGGTVPNPTYEQVSTGTTGHAEVTRVEYDASQISFHDLLTVFFATHDPTTRNRQGNDVGTQYRSAIFYANDVQKHVAEAYIAQLERAHVFSHKIVTEVTALNAFYPAEGYHQNYATLHPTDSYIMFNDAPKVANLKKDFPQMYTGK